MPFFNNTGKLVWFIFSYLRPRKRCVENILRFTELATYIFIFKVSTNRGLVEASDWLDLLITVSMFYRSKLKEVVVSCNEIMQIYGEYLC